MLYLIPSPLSQKTPKQPVLEADLPWYGNATPGWWRTQNLPGLHWGNSTCQWPFGIFKYLKLRN